MDRWVGCEYLHRPRQICTALVGGAYGLHGAGACRRRLALVLPIGDPLHIPQLRRGTRTAGTFSRRPQPPRTPGRGGARGAGSSGYGGAPNHTDRKYCAEGTHGDRGSPSSSRHSTAGGRHPPFPFIRGCVRGPADYGRGADGY